ncbi:MAG: N-acetylneuraminate synthase [Oscillospiraceae bacterium]|nr:N-acetylneuraminate synthase [Oscillospiraceae bacterium]
MHTFIIAEAGVNHNGDIGLAKKLIDDACESGADAVKFQTFIPENVISIHAEKAPYQKQSTDANESQLDMIRKLRLTFKQFIELSEYAEKSGIMFLSTPFDIDSLEFLETIDMPIIKVPSGEIVNLPLLLAVAALQKPVILSTGMSTMQEIGFARKTLLDNGAASVSLLHCNTEYPTPFKDANLRAMLALKAEFGGRIGYSDHTLGTEASIAAVALGAEIIEKHFTTDKALDGPDHSSSLEPQELKSMVLAIRNVEAALGRDAKYPTESEMKNISIARKSIVAGRDIMAGEELKGTDLAVKRPGTGISPTRWFDVIGTRAIRDFKYDELIEI